MEIIQVPTEELKEAEYNPRQMTAKQVKDLTASIQEFGIVDPILVNKHKDRFNIIIGGHQRVKVARGMGIQTVPVVYIELEEEKEKRLNLRLNRNNGEWNYEMLANNFDIDTLLDVGFERADLSVFSLHEDEPEEGDNFDSITPSPVIKGDVYILGRHRIMCGDSTSLQDVNKLMGGAKARMLFTDPPYGVNYVSGGARGAGQKKNKHAMIKNDDLSGKEFIEFLEGAFAAAFWATTPDATFYSWFANSTHREFREAMEKAGWRYSQIMIWIKSHFVLSRGDYHHCYEPCMYGWKDGQSHFSNGKFRSFDDITLLDQDSFLSQLDSWWVDRDQLSTYKHPTQKPVRLAERALKMSTVSGDGVLDLFAGSGSVLLGCEQANRVFYGMELDEKYCRHILNRWAKFTGQDPVREADGAPWSEINRVSQLTAKEDAHSGTEDMSA